MNRRTISCLLLLSIFILTGAVTVHNPSARMAGQPAQVVARSVVETLHPPPDGWPSSLELGMSDGLGGAAAMQATAPFGFRYQYLAGGVNSGAGWATWNPDGHFVSAYVQESLQHRMTPIFTYYMLRQSAPGAALSERDGNFVNLQNPATMAAYFADLRLFFQRAGAFPSTRIVLHLEPDLWGHLQQRAAGDDAATVAVQVGSAGVPELADLPDNGNGFAQAIARLRATYAPNVLLGYHLSYWGTSQDIQYTNPSEATVEALAQRAARFYHSLDGQFDLSFAEFSDRDAGFKQQVYQDGGASWWDAADFHRHVRLLASYGRAAESRVVLWQIPFGNTRMRAMNNTWNHYQDNRVEWLLDDPTRLHLRDYVDAGVLAFLFGRGTDGATCACDGNRDGITDPEPITGNTGFSLSADDDGGFFRQKAQEYYTTGTIPLPEPAGPPPAALSATVGG
jgi:hypothetical protein